MRGIPKRAVSMRNRAALLRTAKRAKKQARRRPCASIRTLRRFNRQLKRVRARKPRTRVRRPTAGSPRGVLTARVVTLNAALLQSPKAKRCGGGKRNPVTEAKSRVLSSSEKQLKMRIQMPPPQFVAHNVGGRDFLEMAMEGMDVSGDIGKPGLPMKSTFFAIPEGANVDIDVSNAKGYTIRGVELYPLQKQPVDQAPPTPKPAIDTFLEPPFRLNNRAYDSKAKFPSSPAGGGALGAMRDIATGAVSAAGGQYQPKTGKLKVFTSIDVTVNFGGDNKGTFGGTDILSPWNNAFVDDYATLANFQTARDRLRPNRPPFCGEELLIITSSDLRPAANTLAAQRSAQGYLAAVREVGSGPGQIGTTPTQIQTFIRSRLNGACLVRPSYVILFGNTAHVPTFLVPCSPGGNPADCNIASDLDYSLNGIGTDLFADVQLGRLPAPNIDAANALVTKLNTYVTTSPAPPGDDFFDHAAVTSYFQPPLICVLNEGASGAPDCDPAHTATFNGHWEIDYPANADTRGFTITAERIRNAIAADGYTVDRLYTTDDEDVIPTTYWNGTPIPSHLRRPAFDWDANTTDFLDSYNAGRFVILHRDHGWPDGFAEPTIHSGHVPGLTNGSQQPVVFGINCASAAFDEPAHPSFVELQVLRPDGGAIAGFGDTRVSPSFPNNHMALGFFDALFPSAVADYGGAETRRLGDVLIRGKQYMATQEGFEWHGSGDTYVEHYLYHLLGDPTMQMWANPPVRFDPSRFRAIVKEIREIKIPEPGDPPFFVRFEFPGEPLAIGSLITVFRGNEAVGRGIVGGDGSVNIVPDVPFNEQDSLTLSLQQDGAFPEKEPVEQRQPTSLSLIPPTGVVGGQAATFTGKMDPVLAGQTVTIHYNNLDTPSESTSDTAVVQPNGTYSDSQTFPIKPPDEDWTAQTSFAGDANYQPSQSNVANFVVHGNF